MELTTLLNGTQLVPQNVYKFQFQVKHFQLIGNFFPDFETFWYQAIHTIWLYAEAFKYWLNTKDFASDGGHFAVSAGKL